MGGVGMGLVLGTDRVGLKHSSLRLSQLVILLPPHV